MEGLFNCTFPGNDTTVELCCYSGNSSIISESTVSCNTTDSGMLGSCLAEHDIVMSFCSTRVPATSASASSSRPRVKLSPHLLFLVALSLLATLARADAQPMIESLGRRRPTSPTIDQRQNSVKCAHFEPDEDQSTWNFAAYTPSRRVGDSGIDCGQSSLPCLLEPPNETVTWTVSWMVDRGATRVDLSSAEIVAALGDPYSESVTSVPMHGFFIPTGQRGYLSTFAGAVDVPGWFRDCDGQDYRGSALVPSRDVYCNIILE